MANKKEAQAFPENAGLISTVTFGYISPLFKIARTRSLELTDLFKPRKDDDPRLVSEKFEKNWAIELSKSKPSLPKAIFTTFGKRISKHVALLAFYECVLRLLQPFLLGFIVRYFSQPNLDGDISTFSAFQAVTALAVISLLIMVSQNNYNFMSAQVGLCIQSSLKFVTYKKLLKLSPSAIQKTSVGPLLNLITSDCERIIQSSYYLPFAIVAPVQSVILLAVMWSYVGYAILPAIGVLLIYIPLLRNLYNRVNEMWRKNHEIGNKRIKLMTEIINAIKLVKIYCWEKSFAEKVAEVRAEEVAVARKSGYLSALNGAISSIANRLILFSSMVTFVLIGGKLNAEAVFVVISLIQTLRNMLTDDLPIAFAKFSEIRIVIQRIHDFLMLPERADRTLRAQQSDELINIQNFSAKWNQDSNAPFLNDINFQVTAKELVIVVGTVGAGKTCLLNAILNELSDVSGHCVVSGRTSYAPQESWCFSGTVRDNILLGDEYDEIKFEQIVDACGLRRDFKIFPNSDLTLVGEKGYTLSGGQKARITLARAVYHDADIYLLDDPLSAVDPMVANHIFENCIKNYLANKSVVLVTHQLQFLKEADMIVVMDNGRISASGTFDELMTSGVDFLSILKIEEPENTRVETERCFSIESNEDDEADHDKVPQIKKDDDIKDEYLAFHPIEYDIYWKYLRLGGGIPFIALAFAITIASKGIYNYTDVWLAKWTHRVESGVQSDNLSDVITYSALTLLVSVFAVLNAFCFLIITMKSAEKLHDILFNRIIRAPMSFFETNSLGKLIFRFSAGFRRIDNNLPENCVTIVSFVFDRLALITVSIVVNPLMAIPAILLLFASFLFKKKFKPAFNQVSLLQRAAQIPVCNHISTSFSGLMTIRAIGFQSKFTNHYMNLVTDSTIAHLTMSMTNRRISIVLDIFAFLYTYAVYLILMSVPEGVHGGDAGLIISSTLGLVTWYMIAIRTFFDLEDDMVPVERVFSYEQLEPEKDFASPRNVLGNQILSGAIRFKDVELQYDDVPVLKNLTFEIESGQKIGIVGRTGAGKTSLLSVLFRLVDFDGNVEIDRTNTRELRLDDLRSNISIIPQDPVLFSGTVRRNLDPFNEYSDDALKRALANSNLSKLVESMDGQLEAEITEGGSNLSVGQRQLLCLARALLKNNKILVLDEATANVDHETDEIIQKTIRTNFASCTVLTVAHRLNTIIDADKVMVMDQGKLVEFDGPRNLFASKGHFYRMVKQTGKEYSNLLNRIAESSNSKSDN